MRTAAALALLLLPVRTFAQVNTAVDVGSRLRVTLIDSAAPPMVATLVRLQGDSLWLESPDAATAASLHSILRLEISRGRPISGVGLALGIIVGGAAGVAAACVATRDDYGVPCMPESPAMFVVLPLLGATVGGMLGSQVGRRDRWESIDPHLLIGQRRQ